MSGRLAEGGRIDRSRPLNFTFDGRPYQGYHGDTLASALLANGVRVVGRSFKYHRPRGIHGAGSEDPSALVRLGKGAFAEPNSRATQVELYDGLVAHSQNNWPTLNWDLSAALGLFSRFLPAGFYYKTFMWPAKLWPHYEHMIRRMAGMGQAPREADPERYEKRHAHCDLLVIGGGSAGLNTASEAAAKGGDVWLVDEGSLEDLADVTVTGHTTAFGKYDDQLYGLVQHCGEYASENSGPRQILWLLRAERAVLATGAIERPLVFANNDRPGIMLTSAAITYLDKYAVRTGERAIVFTNNDSAYEAAQTLIDGGIEVAAIIDQRHMGARREIPGCEILYNHAVIDTAGRHGLKSVTVAPLDVNGDAVPQAERRIDCDLLCLSGGFTPSVHLYSQAGGKLAFRGDIQGLVPDGQVAGMTVAGTANGDGIAATPAPIALSRHRGKQFIDLQNDVTAADVELAAREGYHSVEHLKRYTTLGMGTDQGKTANLNGIAALGRALDKPMADVGVTTYRPPYTPVTIGAFAGRDVGAFLAPTRRTPMQDWHEQNGAVFVPAGAWRRPHYYPRPGESPGEAVNRETLMVRQGVGIVDVSTLGRIDLHGPDTAEFLNRVYINGFKSLAVGTCRYGVMLRDDGMIFDDGTVARMGPEHYIMTTTTANAGPVMAHLERYLQLVWPDLRVHMTSITDQWAVTAAAGPRSRELLDNLDSDIAFANQALPFMGWRAGQIGGISAQVYRISFSGELAYEVAVPADHGQACWEMLLAAGKDLDVIPYGTEALTTLRVEKGHFVMGPEADGRASADDIGLGGMLSKKKDFIGRRSLRLPALAPEGRLNLVGLVPEDGKTAIPAGAIVLDSATATPGAEKAGHVATAVFSPNLDKPIALAMVRNGRQRHGEALWAHSPLDNRIVAVTVVDPIFIDPKGERLRA
ncbi:MAG: 2Fe-2S iron-sulfur cluster-binding protein [Alphaproteobacteria bacterium]|nr:2Fe-2S iron-sulfur cluster-binding protein [Alphaproteobacteria bacterium]